MKDELKALAEYRLERAWESRKEAESLLRDGYFIGAINRIYYSIFYAARALLATKGLDSSRHSGVIALFNKNFVKEKIASTELSRIIHRAFRLRIDGDYKDFKQFSKQEAEQAFADSLIFLQEIEKILKSMGL